MTTAGLPVVIVDDHSLVADALAMALRDRGIEATTVLPPEFIPRADDPAPPGGLVLLDLDLGDDLDGAELVPRLRRAGWRVLLVTGSLDEVRIAVAVAAGAVGKVSKSMSFNKLVEATVRAAEGRSLVGADERERLTAIAETASTAARSAHDRWAQLTPRELQIVDQIAAGRRPAAIAEEFVVSVATVRTQIKSVLAKLEVGSQLEVAALAQNRRRRS